MPPPVTSKMNGLFKVCSNMVLMYTCTTLFFHWLLQLLDTNTPIYYGLHQSHPTNRRTQLSSTLRQKGKHGRYVGGKLITGKDKRENYWSLVLYVLCVCVHFSEFVYVHASLNFQGTESRNTCNKYQSHVCRQGFWGLTP